MIKGNFLKPLTYVLIILVGPLLAYYLIYVQAREEALLDRTFSHLTNITSRTEARFNRVFEILDNACSSPIHFESVVNKNDLGLSIDSEGSSSWEACLNLKNNVETSRAIKPTSREKLSISYGAITVNANTNALVGNIDLSARFHDIFIFNGEDKIVYQKYPENGRVDSLQELTQATQEAEAKKSLINDPLNSLKINYRGRWYLMPSQPLQINFDDSDKDSWKMVGLIEESQFNAEKLQFQPDTVAWVVLFVAAVILIGPFLKIWYLGRLESLRKIDVIFLIGAGFTLCSLLTLVVIHIEARHNLRQFMDHRLSVIAHGMEDNISNELKANLRELKIAETAMRSVYWEMSDAEFSRFWDCAFENNATRNANCNFPNWRGNVLRGVAVPNPTINNGEYRPQDYPLFNMAYLMDNTGCQIVKWATKTTATNPGCFPDRQYFERPLDNAKLPLNLFSIELESDTEESTGDKVQQDFFVEFITSRTTGEKSVAVSIPISDIKPNDTSLSPRERCLQYANSARRTPCVAVTTSAPSLRALQPVLPYGFGYALVDDKGDLLAHHEGGANTELNLIDELGDGTLLQAALYSRSETSFDSDYRSQLYRFFVTPLDIEGSNFSLVVFYSHHSALRPLLESTGTALMAWLIWFAVLFCLALTAWQWNKFLGGSLFATISRVLMPYDVALLFSTAGVIVVSLFWPIFSLFAPLYVVAVLMIWLFKISNNFRSRPLTVVVISWVMMLSATSLPVWGLFRLLNGETFSGFVQLHTLDYQENLTKQRDAMGDWLTARSIDSDNPAVTAFRNNDFTSTNTLAGFWHQYPLFDETLVAKADCVKQINLGNYLQFTDAPSPKANLWRYMLGKLPDYSERSIRLHAMYRNPKELKAIDGVCTAHNLSKDIQANLVTGSEDGISVGLGIVFLVILGVGLWYVLVRTLGLRTENYLRLYNLTTPKWQSGQRLLIYGLSENSKTSLFADTVNNKKRRLILDLRLLSHQEMLKRVEPMLDEKKDVDRDEKNSPMEKDILILNHFDDCLIDKELVKARIELLERIAKNKRLSVAILLTIDPLSFITASYDNEQDATIISRLATVLSMYNSSYFQETPPTTEGTTRQEKFLRNECYHPNLQAVYRSICEQSGQKGLDNNEIIQLVKSRANAIYQQMWNLCTHAEKIMLVELANDNLVNPNNWDIARRLKQRGYLRRDPFHRIFNESFKQFILRMERVENIESWRQEGTSTWHNIRAPLFVVAIGAVIFLAFTQPSFFNSVFAFAAAGTASLPFLVNLIMAKLKSGMGS